MVEPVPLIHPCPACGFLVFPRAFGSEESCPVCGWIDDYLQLAHPDFILGGNSGISLREAQARALEAWPPAIKVSGAFFRDSRWRPLDAGEIPKSGIHEAASPVCYLNTPDPGEFAPYWLDAARNNDGA